MSRTVRTAIVLAALASPAWADPPAAPSPPVTAPPPGAAATSTRPPAASVEGRSAGPTKAASGSAQPDASSTPGPAVAPAPAAASPCAPTMLPVARAGCPEAGRRAVGLRVGRVLVEGVLGLALGGLVGAVGAYGGLNFDLATAGQAGVGMGAGTALGLGLGAATGVYLGGLALAGDGSFGWTLLGSTAGTAIAAGLVALDNRPAMLGFAATVPVAAAVLGYELSSHPRRPRASPRREAMRVVPTFGPTSLGVAGVF